MSDYQTEGDWEVMQRTRHRKQPAMSDPAPLKDNELEQWKRIYERSGDRVSMHREFALALVATVEQARSERDAAYAVIGRLRAAWDIEATLGSDHWRWGQTVWGKEIHEPMSPAEVNAIRRAQTGEPE